MQKEVVLAICLVFRITCGAPDNAGTEFVIGFMENIPYMSNLDMQLHITTSSRNKVKVTISAPRASYPGLFKDTTVTSGEVKTISIDRELEHKGTELQSKGILINSTEEIVVYGNNRQVYSTDGFLALPTDVLDREYVAVCYTPATIYTLVLIVGVEDDSRVSVLLPNNKDVAVDFMNTKYISNDWINITMDRFDSLQLSSKGDLTGARIISDKKVSVLSGNKKTIVDIMNSQDHLVEQLFPVSTWGKSFATVPIPGVSDGDIFRFITNEHDTNISYSFYKNGKIETKHFLIQSANSYAEKDFGSNWYVHIVSDKPILLAQFVKSQSTANGSAPSDPSMILIPPIQQYASDYTFTTPKYYAGTYINYIMFFIPKFARNGLMLNNKPMPNGTVYHDIPNTSPSLVTGYIPIDDGTYTFRHSSPTTVFGAVLFGREVYESYGFPIGLRLAPINKPCLPTPVVRGDGFDNDCDGLIDEERCYPHLTDDDLDGKHNEDCAKLSSDDQLLSTWDASTTERKTTMTTYSPNNQLLSTRDATTTESTTTMSTHNLNSLATSIGESMTSETSTTTSISNDASSSHQDLTSVTRSDTDRTSLEHPDQEFAKFPGWFRLLEMSILFFISVVFLGISLCICKKCCAFLKRSDDDDDDENMQQYHRMREHMKLQMAQRPKGSKVT